MNLLLKVERLDRRELPRQDIEATVGPGLAKVFGARAVEFLQQAFLNEAFSVSDAETNVGPDLLPWSDIDWMLQSQRFWEGRATLYKSGREVPFPSLTEQSVDDVSRTLRRATAQRLDPLRIYKAMKDGGTLVVRGVDECHRRLRDLTQHLQRELMTPVSAFLFVSGGTQVGVGAHWDAWDSLIVQVHGRKRWRIAGETKARALRFDNDVPTPDEADFREVEISAGDVLYLPRGHWHEVTSYDEPSVHLTFNIRALPNIDAVIANMSRLAAIEAMRAPFQNGPVTETGLRAVSDSVLSLASSEAIQQHFLQERAGTPMLKHFDVLESTWDYPLDFAADCVLRTCAPFRFEPTPGESPGTVVVAIGGFLWTFAEAAEPLLQSLGRGEALRSGDARELLLADADERSDDGRWSAFLGQLLRLQFVERAEFDALD